MAGMWYRDPFLIYLTGLLGLLFCRQVFLFFKEKGLEGGAALWPLLSCCAACFSLFTTEPFLQAFWLGVFLAVISLQKHSIPPLPYSMIALLLFGLYPSFWSVCLVMPILFWSPSGKNRFGAVARHNDTGISYILAVGYGFKNAEGDPLLWFLCVVVLAFLFVLSVFYKRDEAFLFSLAQSCALVRSLLLVGLLQIAVHVPLYDCAQAALCALLLDVTCQVCASWGPQWRSLALTFPLLPGFVTLWFGLHAALLLVGPHTSWTLLGLVLGFAIGFLSIIETIFISVSLPPMRIEGAFMGIAALLCCVLPLVAFCLAPHKNGLMIPHYSEMGPWVRLHLGREIDRDFLLQPSLWLLWGFVWFLLINPRLSLRKPPLCLSCPPFVKKTFEDVFYGALPQLANSHRSFVRQMSFLKQQSQEAVFSLRERWWGWSDISLLIWLCALAFLFLIVELSS